MGYHRNCFQSQVRFSIGTWSTHLKNLCQTVDILKAESTLTSSIIGQTVVVDGNVLITIIPGLLMVQAYSVQELMDGDAVDLKSGVFALLTAQSQSAHHARS